MNAMSTDLPQDGQPCVTQDRPARSSASPTASTPPPKEVAPDGFEGWLAARVDVALKRFGVPGTVVALYREGRIHVIARGSADPEAGTAMTAASRFNVGCVSKLFAATLAMRLFERGELALEAPVAHYLPELRVPDDNLLARLTVRTLLNHGSGLDDTLIAEEGDCGDGIADFVRRIQPLELLFEPGTAGSYGGLGAVLLARACEVAGKDDWFALMDRHVLRPLGIVREDQREDGICAFHLSNGPGRTARTGDTGARKSRSAFAPSDGTYFHLTAGELLGFLMSHLVSSNQAARVLAPATARGMQQEFVPFPYNPTFSGFGLGWFHYHDGSLGHTGNGHGHHSFVRVLPDRDTALVVLANRHSSADLFNEIYRHVVHGGEVPAPLAGGRLDGCSEAQLLGTYSTRGATLVASQQDGRMHIEIRNRTGIRRSTMQRIPGTDHFVIPDAGPAHLSASLIVTFVLPDARSPATCLVLGSQLFPRVKSIV